MIGTSAIDGLLAAQAVSTSAEREIAAAESFADVLKEAEMTQAQAEINRAKASAAVEQSVINPVPNGFNPIDAESIVARRRATAEARAERKLREACQGFETMFLQMMYRQMRSTVPGNDLFGNSHAKEIWESMRDDAMMAEVAKSGGVGLADMIYEQLVLRGQAGLPKKD